MKSLWWKARSWLALLRHAQRQGDLLLYLRITLFALSVPVLIRLRLPRLEVLLEPKHASLPPGSARTTEIMGYVDSAIQGGKPLIRPTCLTRGITAYTFLRQAGLDVTLCFGITNITETVAAHCWLTLDGEPLMETRDPRPLYVTMYELNAIKHAAPTSLAQTDSSGVSSMG